MRKRRDANHKQIVNELRQIGFSVFDVSQVGGGIGDLLVGAHGRNFLFEVKDGNKPRSARKLTKDENDFHLRWKGQVTVITSSEEAITVIQRNVKCST